MLGRHDPASIELALNETSPQPPFPPASDRAAWERVREAVGETTGFGGPRQGRGDARAEIPGLPATLYLEFSRAGSREGYEGPANRRREMLSDLALAECLEGEGRFLDPLLDVAWAICEESSWSWPAHQGDLADMDHPVIDLSVAMTALYLAELRPAPRGPPRSRPGTAHPLRGRPAVSGPLSGAPRPLVALRFPG